MPPKCESLLGGLATATIPLFVMPLPAQSVFTISTEPRPAQFHQQQAELFNGPDGAFLLTWLDARDGLKAYYAQRFDARGEPQGPNFKILSNQAVAFVSADTFVVLGHEVYSNPPYEFYRGYIQRYGPHGALAEPMQVSEFFLPPDFVGCPAYGWFLASVDSGYVFGDAFNGAIQIKAFDSELNETYTAPDSALPGMNYLPVLGFAMAATSAGEYVLFWIQGDESYANGVLLARFFNARHEIVADSVALVGADPQWQICDISYSMRALTLADSLYQLFFVTDDTLWYATCSRTGEVLQPVRYFRPEPPPEVPGSAVRGAGGFGVSNPVDGLFSVLVDRSYLWWENGQRRSVSQNLKQDFDLTGRLVGTPLLGPRAFRAPRQVRKTTDDRFQVPLIENDDVYLYEVEGVTLVEGTRVNDDSVGANQRLPAILAAPEGRFLVQWSDEVGRKARMLSPTGERLGEEFVPPAARGWFFPDGDFLTLWRREQGGTAALGYRTYSPSWQPLRDEVLKERTGSVYWLNAVAAVVDADRFLTLLQDSTDLHLLLVSKMEGVLADSLIARGESPFPLSLSSAGDGVYWARWRSNVRWRSLLAGYDVQLRAVSDTVVVPGVLSEELAVLTGGDYAYLAREYFPAEPGLFLTIRNAYADTLTVKVKVAELLAHGARVQSLNGNDFLLSYVQEKRFLTQARDRRGQALTEPLEIYASANNLDLQTVVRVNGARILYAWVDAVQPGRGFDILGALLDVSTVTAVTSASPRDRAFTLYPNYPNPFNPETTIEYELAQPGPVRLSVYNVLGQRVRTLVDAWQPAGRHRVRWRGRRDDGRPAASGVYFYELQAGERQTRRKMLLLR